MPLTRPRAYQISNLDFKQSTRAISLGDVTLSGGAPASVDGVTLSSGDRVLVAGQNDKSENGVYEVDTTGTGSNGTWVRASDFDVNSDISAGIVIMVTEGTEYDDTQWKLTTNDPIIVGTTDLEFARNAGDAFGNIVIDGNSIIADSPSDTFNITSGNNINISANSSSNTATFSVDEFGGTITDSLIPDSNEAYDLGSSTFRFRDLYISGNTIDLAGTTLSITDGDIEVKDAQNNRKKIIVGEIEVGSGSTSTIIKHDNNGKIRFSNFDSSTGSENEANVAATTSEKWETPRILNVAGAVVGNISIDGSQDITLETTANSVGYSSSSFDTDFSNKSTDDLSEGTSNLYYTDTRTRNAVSASGDLSYDSATGTFSFTERTDSEVRNLFSASGDLSYDSATGEFSVTTYKSTDFDTDFSSKSTDDLSEGTANLYYLDSRVDSHLSGGTGVSYSSGAISIGQPVGTADNVEFNDVVVGGDLTVSGTTTTVNTETLDIADNNITLNSNYDGSSPTENGGITVNRGTVSDVVLQWNETNDYWEIASGGTTGRILTTGDEGSGNRLDADLLDGQNGTHYLNYNNFSNTPTLYTSSDFDTDFSNKSTSDLSEGTKLYYTDSRARSAVSAAGDLSYDSTTGTFTFTERTDTQVRGLFSVSGDLSYDSATGVFSLTTYKSTDFDTDFSSKSTDNLSEGTNLYYTDTRASNAAPVQSVAGKTGSVSVTSSDVGLGSVRNVSSYSQTEADERFTDSYATTYTLRSASEVGYSSTSASGRFDHLRGGLGEPNLSFPDALADAASKGVRLPTIEELEDEIVRGTGGGYDSEICWSCTSVPGRPGYVYAILGDGGGSRFELPTDGTQTAYTRYVANVDVPTIYHSNNKPSASDVGLGDVPNSSNLSAFTNDTSYVDAAGARSAVEAGNLSRIDGANNFRIRFDSSSNWMEFTDQSNNRADIVTGDTFVNDLSGGTWLSDLAANDIGALGVNDKASDSDKLDGNDSTFFTDYTNSKIPTGIVTNGRIATLTTATNTNINQSSAIAIEWDNPKIIDDGFSHSVSSSPSRIQVNDAGRYRIYVNLAYDTSDYRINPRIRIRKNGSTVFDGEGLSGYVRAASGHNEGSNSIMLVEQLAAGDYLEVITDQIGNAGTVTLRDNESLFIVEPVQQISAGKIAQFVDSSGGNDLNTSGVVPFDAEIKKDSAFVHSNTTNPSRVEVTNTGWYRISYNVTHNNDDGNNDRVTMRTRVRKNGSTFIDGSGTRTYMRDYAYGEFAHNGTTFVTQLNSGDYIEVYGDRTSGSSGGTRTIANETQLLIEQIEELSSTVVNAEKLEGLNSSQFLRSDISDIIDAGTNTTLTIRSNDSGASTLELQGDSQGTGRVYVGQSGTYGGGIEYNGDDSPSTTGAGSDYITLWRRDSGTDNWTARNKYNSNDWEFRGNVAATYFNGTATSAQYADVAENYTADDEYYPATVIKIGGEKEVTVSTKYADSKVVGVVTTNPALLMNKDLQSEHVVAIALTGRVPCQVTGVIEKGDVLATSDIPGVATRLANADFTPGCVIGKALEDYNSETPGIIEVLVGKV